MPKKIHLTKVKMEGFTSCEKLKVIDMLVNETILLKDNENKELLNSAISWVFTGMIGKSVLAKNCSKAVVKVYFVDENNKEGVLERSYSKTSGFSLILDNQKINQKILGYLLDIEHFLDFNLYNFLKKRKELYNRRAKSEQLQEIQ